MRNNNFWGVLLLIIGVALIGKRLFYFSIKLSGILFTFAFIYYGISMLRGKYNRREGNSTTEDVIFSNRDIVATNAKDKYGIIFGNAALDLTTLPIPVEKRTIKIETVFGRSLIRINPEIPTIIKVGSVFSSARMPNGTQISFGDYTYTTRNYREDYPHLYIKVDVVFGNVDIVE